MLVSLCTSLEALPSSSGRSECHVCHRNQRRFNIHRYCGVASVRKRRPSTPYKSAGRPTVTRFRRTSKCASHQDEQGAVSSTQTEVAQVENGLSEQSRETPGDPGSTMDIMDDSDDDQDALPGYGSAGRKETPGDEIQEVLGRCLSAQEFLVTASRCLRDDSRASLGNAILSIFEAFLRAGWKIDGDLANHVLWDQAGKSMESHKAEYGIQEIVTVMYVLSKVSPQPEALLLQTLRRLDDLTLDIQGIDVALMESLCFLLTRMTLDVNPVVVRRVHEKVICDLPEYSPRDFFGVLCTLSYLRPYLAPGMVTLCWERALELVPFADVKAMSSLLRAMVRIQPLPPKRLHNVVLERCLELAPEMSTQGLSRTLFWIYKSQPPQWEQLAKKLDACMLDKLDEASLSNLHQWIVAYAWLRKSKYQSVDALARKVLTFKSVGPLILGNTLQLLSFVRHKDKELVAKVADRACRCLDEADGHLLVTILKAVTDMKMEHKIMREIIVKIDAKPADLTPKGVLRLISTVGSMDTTPPELQSVLAKVVTPEVVAVPTVDSLVYTIDSLGKTRFRDERVANIISSALERNIEDLDVSTMIFAMKRIMLMRGNTEKLLKAAKNVLLRDLPKSSPECMSHAFETLTLMSQKKVYDKKIMGIAVEGCIYKAAQMAPEEVSRVARGIAKAGIREPVFIEAIGAAAEASFPDMYPRQLCWVLWSFAKVGYKFPMESYSLAATTVSEGVEGLHPHDVSRFLFSCARMQNTDQAVLQRVADYIVIQDPKIFRMTGISIVAWSLCKLKFSHEKFLSWMVTNTQGILHTGVPQALANITLALQTFDFHPGEEYLKEVMHVSSKGVNSFRPFELSIVTQGLVGYNVELDMEYLDACTRFLEENIDQFDGRSACNMLWTLNKSGYRPSQSVVIKACQRVQNNIETIQMKGIGQFLYVVGRSGYKPSDLLKNTVGRVLRMARRMQPASLSATIRGFSICQYLSEPVIQAVRDAAFAKLWEFLPDDLAGLVWGLANLGYREEEFFKKAAICSVDKLDRMKATDIFTLLWAFARAGRPAELFINAGFDRLSAGEMKELNAPQLVSLSWAIAKIGVYDAKLMDALAECVEERYTEFNVKGISTILWAFGTVSHDPGPLFGKLTSQIGKQDLEKVLTWLSLTHVLWSCARLLRRPPHSVLAAGMELLHRSKEDIRWKGGRRDTSQQGGVEARHLMLCLWSLAVFGRHRTELVEGLATRVNSLDILEDMREEEKQQVAQCILAAQARGMTSPLSQLPQHYIAEAMASWRNLVKWNADQEVSLFHKNVATCLLSLGIPHREKLITEDRCMVLDIFVPYSSDSQRERTWKGVALELYGKQHLTVNTQRITGKMVLRQRLLEARGYQVVTVLFSDWEEIQWGQGQREVYLTGKLVNAGVITNIVDLNQVDGDPSAVYGNTLQKEDLGAFVDELEDDLDYQEGLGAGSSDGGSTAEKIINPTVDTALG